MLARFGGVASAQSRKAEVEGKVVTPAKAGAHEHRAKRKREAAPANPQTPWSWVPAFAGMTRVSDGSAAAC
jgi:hypothetical protein